MELQLGSVPVCERPQGLPRGSWGDGRPSFWCSKDPTTPDIYEVLTAHPLHLYALPSLQAGQRGTLAVGSTVRAREVKKHPSDGTWVRTDRGWANAVTGSNHPSKPVGEAQLRAVRQYFLVQEEHAGRFRPEHPECAGARLLSTGSTIRKTILDEQLVTVEKPAGVITNASRKKGKQRFENERVELTAAGRDCLQRGVRKNLLVWELGWRCDGIDTYVCVVSTAVLQTPPTATAASAGSTAGASGGAAAAPTSTEITRIEVGATVLAAKTKIINGVTWICVGQGWARTSGASGTVFLRPSGCARQCGGVCACTASCANQLKSRHGCKFQVKFERPLKLVPAGLVRVTLIGCHAPSGWAPLPYENRRMTNDTKQEILKHIVIKSTARQAQLHLNVVAREHADVPVDDRGSVIDLSRVPSQKAVQQFMTDAKRSGQRGIGQFELAERIIREQLRDPEVASGPRCIYFRKPDDSANANGPRGLYQVIFSSTGCMDDAAELRLNGHGLDGTHKAVEDDICTDALLVFKRCRSAQYPRVPELRSGFDSLDSRLAALSLTDKENKHAVLQIHQAMCRCMPCLAADCQHKWVTHSFADGSGYYACRECTGPQIDWKESKGMIDHHDPSALAYIELGMSYTTCLFHQDRAIGDYLNLELRISSSSDLHVLLHLVRLLAREPSEAAAKEGWKIVCDEILPKMEFDSKTQKDFTSYFARTWMVERWLKSWLDDGRTGLTDWLRLTTNNHIERWHQEYKKTATLDRILKRYPELIERISGRGIFGRSAAPSVMDMAALTARDHSHSDWVPRIPKDVRLRHHLGNCILLVDGLKELVPGKIFAVRAGVAPASVLKLDIETERELVEMGVDSRRDTLRKPLFDHVCAPTIAALGQVTRPDWPHYLVDMTQKPFFCTCSDHLHRGGVRDPCKHTKAVILKMLRGDRAAATAQEELVAYLQARGIAGTGEEIIETVRERLRVVYERSTQAFPLGGSPAGWAAISVAPLSWLQSTPMNVRPAVQNISTVVASAGLRRGPERPEVKLRHRWRAGVDSARPKNLTGAAHRGGGALKRRRTDQGGTGRHGGGPVARARKREKKEAARRAKRTQTVEAKRGMGDSSATSRKRGRAPAPVMPRTAPPASRRGPAPVMPATAPARGATTGPSGRPGASMPPPPSRELSAFMARAQNGGGRFVF